MAKTRTFVAVDATTEVCTAAASLVKQLQPLAGNVRWVADGNLHYTLQFLGDLTDQEIADVCTRVAEAAAGAEPFALEARGAGAFPGIDRPRTLWVGAGRGGEELCALQAAVETELADMGFRGENRRYVPHLTIGRAARGSARPSPELSAMLSELSDFEAGVLPVDEVTIYASRLLREGPEYHVLARCPLGG